MLVAALARARAHELTVGVLMIDLDGFKAVNDRYGHATGVARTGGDEFVVVLPDLTGSGNAAHEAAARIEAAFEDPLVLDGIDVSLHAAVGVACHPEDGDDLDALLTAADRAMYARKAQ